jgi:glycosyltransferase involved in cell wall biosynthesis
VVVLAEEWQTAASLVYLADVAEAEQWTSHLHLVWNANHFFGFDRVRWEELKEAATVTTVSRYMRGQMARWGVEAHVVPNGIGEAWFLPLAPSMRQQLDRSLMGRLKLVKVARWDPDKGWLAAIDAVAELKRRNQHPVLIGRGGQEHHGAEVLRRARAHGLEVGYVDDFDETAESLSSALSTVADRDVILLESFLSLEQQKLLFQSADVVLANSSIEPFGLVGLQAMATGGIAFVGATGEDYATPGRDAIAVETSDPREIVEKVLQIHAGPGQASLMRRAARRSATTYMWPAVLDRRLLPLLHHAAALKDA